MDQFFCLESHLNLRPTVLQLHRSADSQSFLLFCHHPVLHHNLCYCPHWSRSHHLHEPVVVIIAKSNADWNLLHALGQIHATFFFLFQILLQLKFKYQIKFWRVHSYLIVLFWSYQVYCSSLEYFCITTDFSMFIAKEEKWRQASFGYSHFSLKKF